MTISELKVIIDQAIQEGYGNAKVMFDTEARTFDYHMTLIKKAILEPADFPGEPFLYLGE